MKIAFDPNKNERNLRERGLSFERALDFDFSGASIETVTVKGEIRRVAFGYLDKRLHVLVYKPEEDGIRVISFRKAKQKEADAHGKSKTID